MSEQTDDLTWDGERYIPGMSAHIEVEHMHRYLVAARLCQGARVLDIACGEGYGSFALSRTAASVIGVDISDEAVQHARAAYSDRADNLQFVAGSAAAIPLGDASVDMVVSFETIEHHDQHEAMVREIKRVLRPGGLVVISSPNKHEYSDVTGYSNPWHVKELYLDEFEALLRSRFAQVDLYGQRVVTGSMLAALEPRAAALRSWRQGDHDGSEGQVGVARPLYFVALASDGELPTLDATVYEIDETQIGASAKQGNRVECKAYWEVEAGSGWSEQHAMGCYIAAGAEPRIARLELREPAAALKVSKLRFDPSDRPGVVELHALDVCDVEGRVVWSLHTQADTAIEVFGAHRLGKGWPVELIVAGNDPWFEVPVPDTVLSQMQNGWMLSVRLSVRAEVDSIAAIAIESRQQLLDLSTRLIEAAGLADRPVHFVDSLASRRAGRHEAQFSAARHKENFDEAIRLSLARLEEALHEKGDSLARAHRQLNDKTDRLFMLERERERVVREYNRVVAELDRRNELGRQDERIHALDAEIRELRSSTSWRVTSGLRFMKRVTQGGEARASSLRAAVKIIYRKMPLPASLKRKIKGGLFRLFPRVFANTRAYQDWAALRRRIAHSNSVRAGTVVATAAPFTVTAVVPSSDYQAFPPNAPHHLPVRAIAFYLPQFHPFAENDEWWGRGFTEWTNVTRAVPQFVGHYQPHLPGELGFYDLRIPAVQQRQVELAQLAGVGGFCFYFYWFGGKRLMEAPIQQYLEHREFDLPFCLCWANENWSRRWDGLDQELLISQHHSPEDDLAFIEHVSQYLRDERYIRIDGRPLLLVYRPNLLPNARETVARWREWARANGLGELYLAYTQSFERADPRDYGFDAAIEFPPNNSQPPSKADSVSLINPEHSGYILDWTHFVERSRAYQDTPYRLFRGVTPSWDNEARKPGRGTVFVGSTPKLYEEWLLNAATDTVERIENPDERIVFINAWNEWAEGAHLEPDRRYGYAWLHATRNALVQAAHGGVVRRVLVVSHDAHAHGAQFLALNLVRALASQFNIEVATVLLGEGPLKAEFERWSIVHDLTGVDPASDDARAFVKTLAQQGFKSAICNTTVSGRFVGTLSRQGIECISLIHELDGMLKKYKLEQHAAEIAEHAKAVVFPANMVKESFTRFSGLDGHKARLRPQGLYKRNRMRGDIDRARTMLREQLKLPAHAKVVLGVGYGDLRKGTDLFARAAAPFADRDDVHFIWLGHWDNEAREKVDAIVSRQGMTSRFHFPGLLFDTDQFYAGADVLALTSREDPFPSVVLESLEVGVPVVAFEGASGSAELLKQGCGIVVPFEDVGAFADAVGALLDDPRRAAELGAEGTRLVTEDFSFRSYVFDLLDLLGCGFKRVSVVVPNYNYERYIGERLDTILKQDYPIYELIVLDDHSSDESERVIRQQLADQHIDNRVVVNHVNSGSVFAQWKRGVELARGDYVWIAEADDLSDPEFLSTVIEGFDDARTVMSYSESKQMSETGEIVCEHYRDYVADISGDKWTRAYVGAGSEEIARALAIKNTIPNVSAVVFKRQVLHEVLSRHFDEIRTFRVAGDWMVYLRVLDRGLIAFVPDALNLHRRHGSSVTIGGKAEALVKEIRQMQMWVRANYTIDASVVEAADRYARELCAQFGLDERLLDHSMQ